LTHPFPLSGNSLAEAANTSPALKASPETRWRVAFQTLGCRLNQYETDSLASAFTQAGYTVVGPHQQADVFIVNRCTVTDNAERKSRYSLRHAQSTLTGAGVEHKGLVVLTGCGAKPGDELPDSDGRTIVVDNDHKSSIVSIVDAQLRGESFLPPTAGRFAYLPAADGFHTRATLKIQDGCDNFCSFCIIPFVRGRAQSRPLPAIIDEAKKLLDTGYRELVLTGVNMSRWVHGGKNFTDVLEGVLALEGTFRVRATSLEPECLDQRFAELFYNPKLCPQLHLCLQSGSDRILLAMRRQYTLDDYRSVANRLRAVDPLFNLTTDLITGFPGETEADFAKSLSAMEEFGFGHVHVFPFSVRSGTRAQNMPEQVGAKIAQERSLVAQDKAAIIKRKYLEKLLGRSETVLVEGKFQRESRSSDSGTPDPEAPDYRLIARGHGQHYVPVSFALPQTTSMAEAKTWRNRLVTVQVQSVVSKKEAELFGKTTSSVLSTDYLP